jgi:hypothetical protein
MLAGGPDGTRPSSTAGAASAGAESWSGSARAAGATATNIRQATIAAAERTNMAGALPHACGKQDSPLEYAIYWVGFAN